MNLESAEKLKEEIQEINSAGYPDELKEGRLVTRPSTYFSEILEAKKQQMLEDAKDELRFLGDLDKELNQRSDNVWKKIKELKEIISCLHTKENSK